jgi:ATP-dependent Clp protease adapter protein ClpS
MSVQLGEAPGALRAPYHVLLVEDDNTTRMYVEQLLRKCDYKGTR